MAYFSFNSALPECQLGVPLPLSLSVCISASLPGRFQDTEGPLRRPSPPLPPPPRASAGACEIFRGPKEWRARRPEKAERKRNAREPRAILKGRPRTYHEEIGGGGGGAEGRGMVPLFRLDLVQLLVD